MAETAVEVRGLVKRYGAVEAVRGLDLTIRVGEVFALLGPNGAGKTTTVEILEGHRRRTSGRIEVLGFDPETGGRSFRERIGIVLQSSGIDRELTLRELLRLYAPMYPHPRPAEEVIELAGLQGQADARLKTLSGGQVRRADLALGLIGDPDLLFLDEPTTGFDPSARRRAWQVIDGLRSLGKTILLTTHYMDEAQHLADRVAVIVSGEIVAEGTPDELGGRRDAPTRISFRLPEGARLPQGLEGSVSMQEGLVELATRRTTSDLGLLTSWALQGGFELEGLRVAPPSLEDVYLELAREAADA